MTRANQGIGPRVGVATDGVSNELTRENRHRCLLEATLQGVPALLAHLDGQLPLRRGHFTPELLQISLQRLVVGLLA